MKVRPLQFPTYVFNKAGDMRHCKDRDAFDALGPGWENNPAIVDPGYQAAAAEPGADDPDVKWDEGAHAPVPEGAADPAPLNAFTPPAAPAPAAKPAARAPKAKPAVAKPAPRRKG